MGNFQLKIMGNFTLKKTARAAQLIWTLTLKREWKDLGIIRPKCRKQLPLALCKFEIQKILNHTPNLLNTNVYLP